jgi:GcrA cell cycle regulator
MLFLPYWLKPWYLATEPDEKIGSQNDSVGEADMSWTDERVELLKQLWGEGKTAAEIAKVLGSDISRNAVIGKAHRLKLSNRASPIQAPAAPRKPRAVKEAPPPVKVLESVATFSDVEANVSPDALPEMPDVRRKPDIAPRRVEIQDNNPGGFRLIDLKDRMCRWPIGDPRDATFRFCGCTIVSGLPYCSEHAKVAYQSATRSRLLKAEDFERKANTAEATSEDDLRTAASA